MTQATQETAMVQAAASALVKQDYGIDVGRVIAMRAAVEEIVEKVLKEGEHYGEIPGTTQAGKKPKKVLLLPGAEVLCQVFRLRPEFHEMAVIERDDFIYYKMKCKLFNSVTGELVGEALGSANTREEKYLVQTAARLCPTCSKPTIYRSKKREGDVGEPGYFCWANKGGCGAQFSADDKKLIDQVGTVSADKIWNLHHTILSQAQKRPYVRAVRNATGSSNMFTDEDAPNADDEHGQPPATAQHARTSGVKPTTAPKAGATDVQKLTQALVNLKVGMSVDPALPKEEQQAQTKKARLAWANGHLMEASEEPVQGFLELTPEQIKWLLSKAEAGKCPTGW